MLEKLLLRKVLENYQKNLFSSIPFKKFDLSNPPTFNYTENSLHRKCFLCLFWEFSKLLGERLRWNQKQGIRKSCDLQICRKIEHVHGILPKSSSSKNFEKSSFHRSCRLTLYTVCNATKSDFLLKFLKDALKPLENFQEVISNGVPYQRFTDLQAAAFSLARF